MYLAPTLLLMPKETERGWTTLPAKGSLMLRFLPGPVLPVALVTFKKMSHDS